MARFRRALTANRIAAPPTGTTVMMTFAEKVEDANAESGYGWHYAD